MLFRSTLILYFLLMTLIFWLLMHKTTIGRSTFLIGQSDRTSRYSAVPIRRTLFLIYSFIGIIAAFVAVLLVSYFGSARSDLGSSLLMPVLTAVVLGGANIYGGSGSIIGTAIAAMLIGYLQQGLQMIGISNEISGALSGALLIIVQPRKFYQKRGLFSTNSLPTSLKSITIIFRSVLKN